MQTRNALGSVMVVLAACATTSPEATTDSVDAFLAQVCTAAAQCPGVTASPADIAACPSGIRAGLSEAQVSELAAFATFTSSQQSCVLTCIGSAICGRFGGGLGSISDSDVLEPFQTCSVSCGVSGSSVSGVSTGLERSPCARRLEHVFATARAQFPTALGRADIAHNPWLHALPNTRLKLPARVD